MHGGHWSDKCGGSCRAPETSAALADSGYEDFLEPVCALFSGTDTPFAQNEGHLRILTEQNLRTCKVVLIGFSEITTMVFQ